MQLTRREALDEFLGYVNELGDDLARDVAERALNRAIETIWQAHTWRDFQSPNPLELTLTANRRDYPLPDYFGRIGIGRLRNLTRGTLLYELDMDAADEQYPDRGTSLETAGPPCHILLGGITGVQRQPDVAGEALEVVSTSLNDTEVLVSLVAADASGNERRTQVTLNGTTAVPVGTRSYVDDFGKGYADDVEPPNEGTSSEGTVTLRVVSSGTVLQELFPEESAREHRILTVLPKPNAADRLAIPVMRKPPRLLYASDPLPGDWWNAIFEELQVQWRVNTGELAVDSVVARPHLLRLISDDNAKKARPTIKPFGAMR
jgi:hypothetical protein